MDMSTSDRFITLFGTSEIDKYTQDERLAFLQGYHYALDMQASKRPLSILPETHKAPLGLEQAYQAGQIKAESDLEEKKALDAAIITAIIGGI
jgi:hypothetical protein